MSVALPELFHALADPTRLAMVEQLARGDATVGRLGAPHPLTKPAITKHLAVLEGAGLITRTRRGREVVCALVPAALDDAERWLTDRRAFWEGSLDRLADLLEETP